MDKAKTRDVEHLLPFKRDSTEIVEKFLELSELKSPVSAYLLEISESLIFKIKTNIVGMFSLSGSLTIFSG